MKSIVDYYLEADFNPTAIPLGTPSEWDAHCRVRRHVLSSCLHLPERFWMGARVLDVGCSSGENALALARWGARLTCVDALASSLKRLRLLFQRWALTETLDAVVNASAEAYAIPRTFDAVFMEGFLNFCPERNHVLQKYADAVRPGGFLILGVPNPHGLLWEYGKAALLLRSLDGDRRSSVFLERAAAFFREDFERLPFRRPFESWVRDNLMNPLFMTYDKAAYGFEDIAPVLKPTMDFWCSWPRYSLGLNPRWHKDAASSEERWAEVERDYHRKRIAFLFDREPPGEDMLSLIGHPSRDAVGNGVRRLTASLSRWWLTLHEGDAVERSAREIIALRFPVISFLVGELLRCWNDPRPEVYGASAHLRRQWGAPYHLMAFQRREVYESG